METNPKISNKLLELYVKKYLKGELNFNGIILTPKINDENNPIRITWKIENPNDVSYTYLAIRNHIEDSLTNFFELTSTSNIRLRSNIGRYIHFENLPDNIHLSKSLRKKIEQNLKEIKKTKFDNIELTHRGLKTENNYYITSYHEEISVELSLTILKAVNLKTGKELTLEEIEEWYTNLYNSDSTMDFNDYISDSIFYDLYATPTIYDRDESYIVTQTSLYDIYGDLIEPKEY